MPDIYIFRIETSFFQNYYPQKPNYSNYSKTKAKHQIILRNNSTQLEIGGERKFQIKFEISELSLESKSWKKQSILSISIFRRYGVGLPHHVRANQPPPGFPRWLLPGFRNRVRERTQARVRMRPRTHTSMIPYIPQIPQTVYNP